MEMKTRTRSGAASRAGAVMPPFDGEQLVARKASFYWVFRRLPHVAAAKHAIVSAIVFVVRPNPGKS